MGISMGLLPPGASGPNGEPLPSAIIGFDPSIMAIPPPGFQQGGPHQIRFPLNGPPGSFAPMNRPSSDRSPQSAPLSPTKHNSTPSPPSTPSQAVGEKKVS